MSKKISDKLSDKLNDKFGGVFGRQKPRQEIRSEKSYFNQTYFDVKLSYHPQKLSLMKIDAFISVGPDAGTPMMVNCKWLVKKGNQLSQIQGVRSPCYQPCIEDVGCSICVQIEPLIEGKIYSGATIIKQTKPLQLGATLETHFTQLKNNLYHYGESVSFDVRIQALLGSQTMQQNIQFPLEGKITICKQDHLDLDISIKSKQINVEFWITKEYPIIQFIRKSYNSIIITFSQSSSFRLAFKENIQRQLLGLLIRTFTANSSLDWPIKGPVQENIKIQEEEEDGIGTEQNVTNKEGEQNNEILKKQTFSQEKIEVKQNSCEEMTKSVKSEEKIQNIGNRQAEIKLQLKIGTLNSELNKIKSQYKQLLKNYQLEKQAKNKLESQNKNQEILMNKIQSLEKENARMNDKNLKLAQDNRFYKNQIALMKKSMKETNQKINMLQQQKNLLLQKLKKEEVDVKNLKKQQTASGSEIDQRLSQMAILNSQLNDQNQCLRIDIEKLQNQLKAAHRKINSLCQEKTMVVSPVKSEPVIPLQQDKGLLDEKIKTIKDLQFKLSNLQMLLKFKSGEKGNEGFGLQKIINSLTQALTEKDEQLQEVKKINKQLLKKLSQK